MELSCGEHMESAAALKLDCWTQTEFAGKEGKKETP
jgi:hypothetical protein